MTTLDKDSMLAAYEDVRNDSSETAWAVFKFEGNSLIVDSTGEEYEEFVDKFGDDERAFGFVRIYTGDELSKRAKFAMITWCGCDVSPLKRAKMSTDKAIAKQVIQSVAVEIQTSEKEELTYSAVKGELIKAGGANYGTGARD